MDWREKLRELIREAAKDCIDRPIYVLPKRSSNPRLSPPDWHEADVNATLPRQDDKLPPAA